MLEIVNLFVSLFNGLPHCVKVIWIYDTETDRLVNKEIDFIPALYKIYDEIIVNAADNKVRDENQTLIRVDISKENNEIAIMNNGRGIPIEIHKEHNVHIPSMIFGEMMTSSNYDDDEKKVTGGRNGFGAKLCNIFSQSFTVETATGGKRFKQTWTGNMKAKKAPKIDPYSKDDYTKITFRPDLGRFKVDAMSDDMVSLFRKRAYDIAGTTPGLKVFLDGKRISFGTKDPFKDYCAMYTKGIMLDNGKPATILYERPSNKEAKGRWDVGFCLSDNGFQNVSFVNSISTSKGGRHVDVIMEQISKKLEESVNKKNKGGMKVKAHQIKQHCWLFVKAQIENPSFDSQTKENLTLVKSKHGSKPELSADFIKKIEKSGVVETICNFMKFKENQGRAKQSGTKAANVVIEKLIDATEAGKKGSKDCTLILTEGDSAKTAALAGVSSLQDGRRHYGLFPLRGKMLNAREASHKQLSDNKEIKNVVKAMGFDYKRKYDQPEDLTRLRYGKLMIMTDQDVDGSHIKGLVVNFLHTFWPNMIRTPIIQEFITPIVKVTPKRNKKDVRNFYSLPEFQKWQDEVPNPQAYDVKYYKGLGTSTAVEFKEYFADLRRHKIPFRYSGTECDERITMAFQRDRVEDRKVWLTEYMEELARRKREGEPELTLYDREQISFVSYKDFIDKELVLFSNESCQRAIPNVMDGLKPGQRKVMFVCFNRKGMDKKEVKVAQLAGSVAEKSAYHHGEVSLMETIIKLAQDYVGSNNINLLTPNGQFGTRRLGGNDHAAARYIFTQLSPLSRVLFPEIDDQLYEYNYDDNLQVEPIFYAPIIPMVLVNGSQGIGTGWSTNIPNHCPKELAKNVLRMIDGQEPVSVVPHYRGFRGEIIESEHTKCHSFGEVAVLDDDTLEVTELPVGVWTESFTERLQKMIGGKQPDTQKELPSIIEAWEDHSSETLIRIVIKLSKKQMLEAHKQGYHNYLSLSKSMSYTNGMVLFDEMNRLQVFKNTSAIMKNHFNVRSNLYVQRYKFMVGKLEAEACFITNRARFICENIDKKITVMNKKKKVLIEELFKAKYDSDPIKAWKKRVVKERGQALATKDGDEAEDASDEEVEEGRDFSYLYTMPIFNLTKEKKDALLEEKGKVLAELESLKKKKPNDLWKSDIEDFLEKLDKFEKAVQDEIDESNKKAKAKQVKGRAKKVGNSTDPTPGGERVLPKVTEQMKKSQKSGEAKKAPKAKKEPKAEKSPKKEKVKKEPKQLSPDDKKKKKGKQAWETDSEDEMDEPSDGSFGSDTDPFEHPWDDSTSDEPSSPAVSKPAAKPSTKRSRKISSDEEDSQQDLKPVKKKQMKQGSILDMMSKGKKKVASDSEESPIKKKKTIDLSDSEEIDSDVPAPKKKAAPAKKPAPKAATKKAAPKKKKVESGSEDDFKNSDSDEAAPISLASRAKTGRGAAAKTKKYNFSSDDDSD